MKMQHLSEVLAYSLPPMLLLAVAGMDWDQRTLFILMCEDRVAWSP